MTPTGSRPLTSPIAYCIARFLLAAAAKPNIFLIYIGQMGYITSSFGKLHLGHQPNFTTLLKGYDGHFTPSTSNNMFKEFAPEKDDQFFTGFSLSTIQSIS